MILRWCCGPGRPPPTLPRYARHDPLGTHLLLAKMFAGWHGFICQIHREQDEVRHINERVRAATAMQAPRAIPAPQSISAAERRSSLKAARAAEISSQLLSGPRGREHDEIAYIKRHIQIQQEEFEQKQRALEKRNVVRTGLSKPIVAHRKTTNDDEDELVVLAQPLPSMPRSPDANRPPSAPDANVKARRGSPQATEHVRQGGCLRLRRRLRRTAIPSSDRMLPFKRFWRSSTNSSVPTSEPMPTPLSSEHDAVAMSAKLPEMGTPRPNDSVQGVDAAAVPAKSPAKAPAPKTARRASHRQHGEGTARGRSIKKTSIRAETRLQLIRAARTRSRTTAPKPSETHSTRGDSYFVEANGRASSAAGREAPGRTRSAGGRTFKV